MPTTNERIQQRIQEHRSNLVMLQQEAQLLPDSLRELGARIKRLEKRQQELPGMIALAESKLRCAQREHDGQLVSLKIRVQEGRVRKAAKALSAMAGGTAPDFRTFSKKDPATPG